VDKGSLTGTFTYTVTGANHRLAGTARWFKKLIPGATPDVLYRDGFGPLALTATGAQFKAPAKGAFVAGIDPAAKITFSPLSLATVGSVLEGSLSTTFTIRPDHKITLLSGESNLRSLILYASNGTFKGKVEIGSGANKRQADFFGHFVPPDGVNAAKGYGYMLIPRDSAPGSPLISSKVVVEKQ
jgi:hypothetical protein